MLVTPAEVPALVTAIWPGLPLEIAVFALGSALAWIGSILAVASAAILDKLSQGSGKLIAYLAAAAVGFVS